MQALILAGGQGTRLRPLTLTTPKPAVPLAGRPFLTFMLDWLARHGVDEAILSCGFLADEVARVLGDRHGTVHLRYMNEPEPLGTAGPLRLAFDEGALDERLLVLNGDVLTDVDLSAQLDFHRRADALATLALVPVEDTSAYGLVPTAPDGEVEAFLEKDDSGASAVLAPTDRVNAGAYVLERSVAELVPPGRAVSFEREIFPSLVGTGLFGHRSEGYWIDIGTPERYLEATHDLLSGAVESSLPPRDATGSLVYPGCRTDGADVGPLSVLGESCLIEPRARVARSALHHGVTVGADAVVDGAVLADGVSVGERAHVEPGAVVGRGASVAPEARVEAGVCVQPGAL
ncbi:MAG: NDP-sugar synthase, partial [Thermoleophilaceae bacterium]|nr:NDP-sugar synthase [Thermoleophilaceae bacterium]